MNEHNSAPESAQHVNATPSINELWEAFAIANGKGPDFLSTKKSKFPTTYEMVLDWSLIKTEPMVLDWTKDGLWNEQHFFTELLGLFAKRATPLLKQIKTADPAKAKYLGELLKRIETEPPSNELLGLYAVYRPTVDAAEGAASAIADTNLMLIEDSEKTLRELGERFYKVKHSGKAVLYDVINDEWTWYEDCKSHLGHIKVRVLNDAGKPITRNAFDAFKEWSNAPRYDRITFNPRKDGHYVDETTNTATFNLWTGIQVKPEAAEEGKGDDLMLWDLLLRICDGNVAYFEYVQKWLAHMVQKPWERPGTALGISGEQGLGKNAFVETVGMLLSTPQMMNLLRNSSGDAIGKVLSTGAFGYFVSYDDVFGNFNALAGNKLLLLLDEATWGGFHNQKARFKTAITGPTIMINDKHMKQLEVTNYRRFILLSNDGHYLGVDSNDRRLLPLEFKTENRPSDEWFDTFYALRKDAKMLQHLLQTLQSIELKGWEPMLALKQLEITTGAALQQGSAPDYVHWLEDIAETGKLLVKGDNEDAEFRLPACGEFVDEDTIRQSYQHVTGHKDIKGWKKVEFVEFRDKILGPKVQRRVHGDPVRGRRIPDQTEMQKRLAATSKWKYKRFATVIDEDTSPKVVSINKASKLISL